MRWGMNNDLYYNLDRFILAQEIDFERAYMEIQNGKKVGHWIWYIFPQIYGLGHSETAIYYSIKSLDEARAYLNNEYLRNNLINISIALRNVEGRSIEDILDYPDNLKVQSCMTLFSYIDSNILVFKEIIDKYYERKMDQNTLNLIKKKNID